MGTDDMDADDQAANWLEIAKHYISKCNPIPFPKAQTYYVNLWNCKFSRAGSSDLSSAFVSSENGDPEVQSFLGRIYENAERSVAIPGLGDKLKRVYREAPRLDGLEELPQDVNVALGRAIGPWDKAELYSKNEVVRCLIQKVSNHPAKMAHISWLLNFLTGYARIRITELGIR